MEGQKTKLVQNEELTARQEPFGDGRVSSTGNTAKTLETLVILMSINKFGIEPQGSVAKQKFNTLETAEPGSIQQRRSRASRLFDMHTSASSSPVLSFSTLQEFGESVNVDSSRTSFEPQDVRAARRWMKRARRQRTQTT